MRKKIYEINKNVDYLDLYIKILNIKEESNGGISYLTINEEVENKGQKEIFVFWNEELRLLLDKEKIISMNDYNLETDFTKGKKASGKFYFFTGFFT